MPRNHKRRYDCIIVGGGPAGAAAARRLMESGAKVLLIEKKEIPRMKICSGLLGTRAQEKIQSLFGDLPLSALARPHWIKACRVSIEGNEFVEKPLDLIIEPGTERRRVLQVWRSKFDQWLVDLSKVEVRQECRFVNLIEEDDHLLIQCQSVNGRIEGIETDFLIGADGGDSTVRRRFDPAFDKTLNWLFSYKVYFEGTINLERGYFYCFLHQDFGDFYSALLFKDGLVTLGTTVNEGCKIKPFFTKYIRYLCERFGLSIGPPLHRMGCWVNDMGASGRFFLGGGRVLLVGEAAGFLNVMGEGISSALSTGDIAGQAIFQSIQTGREVEQVYREMVEREKEWTKRSWTSNFRDKEEAKIQKTLKDTMSRA